ncbi:hypothetical protein [Roseateles sp. LYH14W]|uniref:TNase-like domain-containing protein n=1 Tax=Pelomonas parva TaxID=3299032 RepID=A0ABW7EWQ6_9BURK
MDYRALLTIPLAALALSASGGAGLRQPSGWESGSTYRPPQGATHEAGVAPETENSGQRALTVKAIGKRELHDIGSVSQTLSGYAGQRVRFSAQVKTVGVDQWAGLAVGPGYMPFWSHPESREADADATVPRGAAGCPEWCNVSVVVDIPAETRGRVQVGLALVGNGQVWARGFKLETVGHEVPVSSHRFAAEAAAATKARKKFYDTYRLNRSPTAPKNLSLK